MTQILPDPSTIKLITTDLDGTLINSKGEVSERTRDTVKRVLEKYPDVHFVLASGRAMPATMLIRESLDIVGKANTESLLLNGCIIYDHNGGIVWQDTLPIDFVVRFHELLKQYPQENYFYSAGDDAVMFDEAWAKRSHERYHEHTVVYDKEEYIKMVQTGQSKVNKLCLIVTDSDDNKVIREKLEEIRKAYDLECAYSTSFFLEFMPPRTNKGTALTQLIEKLHLTPEQVIAFGDGGNDLELLGSSGWPVAMANACEPLKKVARLYTKSNEEDGVADLLERIFLKDELKN